jgi:S1-C subfamily serine protease
MCRALRLAVLLLVSASAAHAQTLSVLRITAAVVDAEGRTLPVARHVLLISDNPPTAPPRAILTTRQGTADVRLRPGNYTVESERPIAFHGRVYQWTKRIDIAAGSDAALELTADNADPAPAVSDAAPATSDAASASPLATDPSFLLPQWQASVMTLWTATTHGSGFLVDARGLVATSQRVIGAATTVEVQIARQVKVRARVLAADPARDVAVLWIDPAAAASVRPVALGCAQEPRLTVVEGQDLFTIGAPFRGQKSMTTGTVDRVEPRSFTSDLRLPTGSAGGPVFTADGGVVGLSSVVTDADARRDGASRVVRIDAVCDLVSLAEKQMRGAAPPNGTLLPVEPIAPFPERALDQAAPRSLSDAQMSSSDFDITFITPVLIATARAQSEQTRDRGRNGQPAGSSGASDALRPFTEFGDWSEYVSDVPPVLLIRVTPKMTERFWTTVARGAAQTQGVSLPPIKRLKAGFASMRVVCGGVDVTPVHPFLIERPTTGTDAIYEGLYAFGPDALGPHCATVEVVLQSEKDPAKGETRRVAPALIERIWQDFAPYRALAAAPAVTAQDTAPSR